MGENSFAFLLKRLRILAAIFQWDYSEASQLLEIFDVSYEGAKSMIEFLIRRIKSSKEAKYLFRLLKKYTAEEY